MSQLPTDIIHQPQDTADICERVMAVLPKQSPFAMIADNRKKVLKLREQAAALTSDDKKLGKEFASTRTKSFKSREIDKFFPPWM